MAKRTIRDRLIDALSARGFQQIVITSRKYVAFESSSGRVYFVGKNGALRTAQAASVTASIPSPRMRDMLLTEVPE